MLFGREKKNGQSLKQTKNLTLITFWSVKISFIFSRQIMDNISNLTSTVIAKNIYRNKLIFSLNSTSPEPSLIHIYFVKTVD